MNYSDMFLKADKDQAWEPYPYQVRLAEAPVWPDLAEIPAGAGRTAAIVLAWVWRRRYAPLALRQTTPRRLVYTLPARALAEPIHQQVAHWISNLGLPDQVKAHLITGGETDWDQQLDQEAVIIGGQDMLLSRALNRGYGMSHFRWPVAFGCLSNDCQWVVDDALLMGSGLSTTGQLAAFWQTIGTYGKTRCLWVSSVLKPEWMEAFDLAQLAENLETLQLSEADWQHGPLQKRLLAKKRLEASDLTAGKANDLAKDILASHRPSSLTLVIVNTLQRARKLYTALQAAGAKAVVNRAGKRPDPPSDPSGPEIMLFHSHFRPPERRDRLALIESSLATVGRIIVATPTVEIGLDTSACTLWTELAPWPAMVERCARCNRHGEYADGEAQVHWINLVTAGPKDQSAPYRPEALNAARSELIKLTEASPHALNAHVQHLSPIEQEALCAYTPRNVLRRRALLELFDTSADLDGNAVNVSAWVSEGDFLDVQVFWRELTGGAPQPDEPAPAPDELCPVPVALFREFYRASDRRAFIWEPLDQRWAQAGTGHVIPGQMVLLPLQAGAYTARLGWDGMSTGPVGPVASASARPSLEAAQADTYAAGRWATISDHTARVVIELRCLLDALNVGLTDSQEQALLAAAKGHDWGKAHPVFQAALTFGDEAPRSGLVANDAWATAPARRLRYQRGNGLVPFRHELASALAMVATGQTDLACYLAAAHHGRVRMAIHPRPGELRPPQADRRYALGLWEGDELPPVCLEPGETAAAVRLPLTLMDMGTADGRRSWSDRVLSLRETLGPFRLAYLEAILRTAHMRANG